LANCRIIQRTLFNLFMKENAPPDFSKLRKEAEKHLAKNPLKENSNLKEGDLMKLEHELHVHKIELEMQNEELIRTKNQAIRDIEKHVDLFDFIPSGIITISDKGMILNINYMAAKLLDNDRRKLKNTPFIDYIHPKSRLIYNQSFSNGIPSVLKKPIELFLLSKIGTPTCVVIDTIPNENTNHFSFTLFDITDYKRQEEALSIKLNDLKEINNHFLCRELKLMEIKEEVNNLLKKVGCDGQYLI